MSAPDVATCPAGPPPLVAATTRGYGCPMPRSRRSRPPKRPSRASRHARATGAYRRAAVNRAEGRIAIRLPQRRREPQTVIAHLGPTNSGKTHDALAFLAEHGRGVYAGPLRMLAQEAHRRLGAVVGTDQVGLLTGEERINEHAPILCCTVEMAPDRGEVLVLDEVQWADDEERGAAWTELLLAGEYDHVRLLGALDALPLVRRAFPDAELRVHERKLPLEFVGAQTAPRAHAGHRSRCVQPQGRPRARRRGEPGEARSRRRALRRHAARLPSRGDRPLPLRRRGGVRRDRRPRARRQPSLRDAPLRGDDEVRRRVAPRPLPLGARADRRARRPLRARRARPRRRSRRRRVGERRSRARRVGSRATRASSRRVTAATASSTRHGSDRGSATLASTTHATSTPRSRPGTGSQCASGHTRAGLRSSRCSPSVAASPSSSVTCASEGAASASRRRGSSSTRPSTRTAPSFSACSRSPSPAIGHSGRCCSSCSTRIGCAMPRSPRRRRRAASPRILRWFALQYPGVGGVTIERAAELEQAAAQRVVRRLAVEVREGTLGRCRSCGRTCPPWYPLCERCARSGRR